MKVVMTGATGFVGQALAKHLHQQGHSLVVLSRNARSAQHKLPFADALDWSPVAEQAPAAAFEGADAVIHLAGESVQGRWSASQRAAIADSRIVGTRNLVDAMIAAKEGPKILVSTSAIGFYGDRGDDELNESSTAGDTNDFLTGVCIKWEAEAARAREHGIRVAIVRVGVVLAQGGGALDAMLLPTKMGAGGPLGSGNQWWAWIHREDLVGIYTHALTSPVDGVLNGTAPQPVRQKDFAKALGAVLKRPAFMPAPAFALKLVLGGFSQELLSSKKVLPKETEASGYRFQHPELGAALRSIL